MCLPWLTSATLLAVAAATAAGPGDEPEAALDWIRAYLGEFSLVTDESKNRNQRQRFSTRLMPHANPGTHVLVYEWTRLEGPDTGMPASHQLIYYTFSLSDLDPETIDVRIWAGPLSGKSYWMVGVKISAKTGFIPYSNLVEERLPDGSVDITNSRGKARTLAIGYFGSRHDADRLAQRLRSLLRQQKRTADLPA